MMKSCFMPPSISYSLFYIGWMKAYRLNFPGRNSHVFIRVLPPRIKYRITRHGESGRWICESMENCLVGTFVIYSGGWLTYHTHLLPPNLFSPTPLSLWLDEREGPAAGALRNLLSYPTLKMTDCASWGVYQDDLLAMVSDSTSC